jgi:DNA replication ATP-dependent helicase Dna2
MLRHPNLRRRTGLGLARCYSGSAMAPVNALIDQLLDSAPATVAEAGEHLLRTLSGDGLRSVDFLSDPLTLVGPPYFASRYLAQVVLRALKGQYETPEEILASLTGLIDRNPPILEPRRERPGNRVVLPEAKVLDLRHPTKDVAGVWESSVEVLITSGPLRDREFRIIIRSDVNRGACFLVPHLWIHSSISVYNLVAAGDGLFTACPETFLVLEPTRQVNVTSIARSLHCTKPQLDQMRRGKGDVTIHTLKGQLVHALFDRLLEGKVEMESAYREVLPTFLIPLASITDEFFDEEAFRADVLRHTAALKEFIDRNPHLLENTQLELKRYSATIGIQGRIDALFRQNNRLDILELKTGARIRPEDHAQLFIYRLLLSDLVRRWQRTDGQDVEITSRLLSSIDGSFAPMRVTTDFYQVLDARNKLIAMQYALGRSPGHITPRFEGFNNEICGYCPPWTRNRCRESSDVFGDRPNAPESAELEFFRRFTRLVERERWTADQEVSDLLDDSRLEFRVKNFRAIRGARILHGAEPFTFEFEKNTSDLERGDSVLIHSGCISSTATYHGYVRDVDTRRIRISIPLKNLEARIFDGQEWVVDRFPSNITAEASHTALYDFLAAPMDARKKVILGQYGAVIDRAYSVDAVYDRAAAHLNQSQNEAIQRAVDCDVFHLIWGPPGTGKTKVIPEIIKRVSGPVLLGAFTNTAVDKMLLALLDSDPAARFLRVGRASDSPELAARLVDRVADFFTDDLAQKYGSIAEVKRALQSASIVAATAHRASTIPYLRMRAFEMTIVDEAGQLTEPLTLGLILRARRFVLIGDDRQLPPVVRTRELSRSTFERLKQDGRALTLLDTQYRMHPEIMAVSNRLFYDGRLRSGITAAERTPPDGQPLLFVPVMSNCDGRSNVQEARVVVDLVRELVAGGKTPAQSIGVVSPFRAQVVLLRQMLDGVGVSVDTVERFQGGERDVMILSFVRSRGSGFVFDDRRLNVAITRARRKLILVGHPELFEKSRYSWISTFTETRKTVGTT